LWAGGWLYVHSRRFGADGYLPTAQPPCLFGTLASHDKEATILRSYVLIQTESGRATDVTRTIRGVPGVISTETVTGPYDVVVLIEAEDVDALGRLVVTAIQSVEGIVRTLTCPVVNL
jgi:DNA-binding Lrp family transcriptional regulator